MEEERALGINMKGTEKTDEELEREREILYGYIEE
jgi:hypothetical protein